MTQTNDLATTQVQEGPLLKRFVRRQRVPFSPGVIPYTFFTFSVGFSQGPSVTELHQSQADSVFKPYAVTLGTTGLLFGGVFLAGCFALWRCLEVGRLVGIWLMLPFLAVLGLSILTNLGYNVRYVALVMPAYIMVLAAGIGWFRHPFVRAMLLVLILASNALSLHAYYVNPRYARADARAAADYLRTVVEPGDMIFVVGIGEALRYYAKDDFPIEVMERPMRIERPIEDYLHTTIGGHTRLWIVELRRWEKDPKGEVNRWLDHHYRLIEERHFPSIRIYHYQSPPLGG
jgi:hypothetical protein